MPKASRRIAALDIGTNSFHVLIVDVFGDGTWTIVDTFKEMVALGEGVAKKRLSDTTMERALEAMVHIQLLCKGHHVEKIVAYATSAIRETENGGIFIQNVIDKTGIKILPIPGNREAELIALAVQHSIQYNDERALLMDIGGGSVEFIIADQKKIFFLESVKLGVSRTAATFIKHDPITSSEIESIREHYASTLTSVFRACRQYTPSMLIGSSGTMENIATMIQHGLSHETRNQLNQFNYLPSSFNSFYENFLPLSEKERLLTPGLDSKRVNFILPGLILTKFILEHHTFSSIHTSSSALREGMILDYIKKNNATLAYIERFPSVRERSVFQLLEKCNWHEAHSRQVSSIALKIFDAFSKELELSVNDRELLHFASLMHDIGYHISHRKHHKHALYIIQHADLKGFTPNEVQILAHTARYHRRSTPKKRHIEYHSLPQDVKETIKKLSGILRVADGLDRSHFQNVRGLKVTRLENKTLMHIETHSDPQVEMWGAMRKSALFCEITGKKLHIEVSELEASDRFSPF